MGLLGLKAMYKEIQCCESPIEEEVLCQAGIPEAHFRLLIAFRRRCLQRYAEVLGEGAVLEAFAACFFTPPEAERWTALRPEEQAERFKSFDDGLCARAEALVQEAARELARTPAQAVNDDHVIELQRPRTRAECPSIRPCPFVSCRYHLYLDVTRRGRVRVNFPDQEVDDLEQSCALDLADTGPRTLEEIGQLMGGISRERVRQIEQSALTMLRNRGARPIADFLEEDPHSVIINKQALRQTSPPQRRRKRRTE